MVRWRARDSAVTACGHQRFFARPMPCSPVMLARELTKKFEEFLRGKPAKMLEHAKQRSLKGEFVVLVESDAEADTTVMV